MKHVTGDHQVLKVLIGLIDKTSTFELNLTLWEDAFHDSSSLGLGFGTSILIIL